MCTQYIEQQDAQVLSRKRFDSVAMAARSEQQQQQNESDFTTTRASWQQQPSEIGLSICETGKQRAAQRPAGLPFDCWNSPLCPRNMPQNGSARSAGQTVCNPGTSLSTTTDAAITFSRNDTPSTDIVIPADSPPFDARPSLKRARTDTTYDRIDEAPAVKPAPKEKRLPHHVIERRYRENLNTQIEQLRAAVPSTTSPCLSLDMEDIGPTYASASVTQNAAAAAATNNGIRPLSKAGVIAHAAEYMRQLSTQNDEVEKRNAELRMTVEALRRLVNCEGCGVVQQLIDAGN
ncbi:unnamed protein product [Aureobasidium uvarum]|uniref:BHLH domain-containing protein n=1 Tax=Aureobasidium uvarum TaxID=2773716 RepID=A0A9N8KA68_9PEZI|nr:unnamed protein product [Aureobasidium uvarum]